MDVYWSLRNILQNERVVKKNCVISRLPTSLPSMENSTFFLAATSSSKSGSVRLSVHPCIHAFVCHATLTFFYYFPRWRVGGGWVGWVKWKLKLNSAQLKLEFGLSLAKTSIKSGHLVSWQPTHAYSWLGLRWKTLHTLYLNSWSMLSARLASVEVALNFLKTEGEKHIL